MKKFKWLPWLIFVAVLVFLLPRLSEHEQLVTALQNGDWWWLLAAFSMSIVLYAGTVEIYRRSYRMVGVERSFIEIAKVYFASIFVNTITAGFGIAGAALFIKDTRLHGYSHVRGLLGFAVETLILQTGLAIVLLLLFAGSLLGGDSIDSSELIMLFFTLGAVATQISVYALVFFRPVAMERLLRVLSGVGNWVSRRLRKMQVFPEGWSEGRVKEMQEIVETMITHKRKWGQSLGIAILSLIGRVMIVFFLLLSFRQPVGLGVLTASFVGASLAGALFTGPHGIGVVELGLTLILAHYGVDRGAGTLIAVVFRGFTFWLPFLTGFFAFRGLKMFEEKTQEEAEEKTISKNASEKDPDE